MPARLPRQTFLLLLALALTIAIGGAAGCQRSLFPENAPRTQFEMHDRMRQRYVPTEVYDVFGRPRPALRERLSSRQ